MPGLTRNNIAHNLEISPHFHDVGYSSYNIRYMFSSAMYREKFIARLENHREQIGESLSNRFGFKIEVDVLSDMKLYTTIEKRGFLVYRDEVEVKCPEEVKIAVGELVMM